MSLLLVIAVSLGANGTFSTARAENTIPLRIVTFNAELVNAPRVTPGRLQKYRFDYGRQQHIERIAHLIETLDPDILNLCEVTSKQAVDMIVDVLHEKGMTDYQGHHVDSNDKFTALDVAVIAKFPLDEVEGKTIRTFYSPADDPTYRQSYSYEYPQGQIHGGSTSLDRNSMYFITVGGHRLGFLGLHLRSNPSNNAANAKRAGEAEIARRLVRTEIVERGYLPIVLGDLNDYDPDVPDRDDARNTSGNVLRNLKDFDTLRPGAELVNVASLIPRKADRYTNHWDRNENRADDPQDVYTMLDHILLPQELMPHVTRAFISHSVSADVSDHFPVVVDLALPTNGRLVADP